MEDAILKTSILYIEAHLTETLNLPVIAGHAGYSVYHFSRLFQEKMQCSVMEYVRKRRLYKASEDILSGKKIIDAAYEYGWQSHNSFTRAFKAEYGFPPSFLRAMYLTLSSGGAKMEQITLKNLSEDKTKEELLDILRKTLEENETIFEEEKLMEAYHLCCQIYHGIKRYSGSEYVTHLLHVAILLADMKAEENVVYAGMFCDAEKKTVGKAAAIEQNLPKEVWQLVKKVNECKDPGNTTDENVLLIKMAERLHNMRTVEFMEKDQMKKRTQETFEIFLPIARKLNNEKLVSALNDVTVRYI